MVYIKSPVSEVSLLYDQADIFRLESTFQYILKMYNNGKWFAEIKMLYLAPAQIAHAV